MTNSIILASLLTIIYITVVTIAGELFLPLKESLKNVFSHHWIGKSITSFIFFFILLLLLSIISPKANVKKTILFLKLLIAVSVASSLVIFGFFVSTTVF